MIRPLDELPLHEGDVTVASPQKSGVVPQKPNWLQQTFSGHPSLADHSAPHPGSHSDLASQVPMQFSAEQKSAPNPQLPY
jgi:hypothetical protein